MTLWKQFISKEEKKMLDFHLCFSSVKLVTNICVMKLFNTSCQRMSLQALPRTTFYVDFDSL